MDSRTVVYDIDRFAHRSEYELLVEKKNAGGNCESCQHVRANDTLQCAKKRLKTVNKFGICHMWDKKETK